MMIDRDEASRLAGRFFDRYCVACEESRLTDASAARIIGITPSRFSQIKAGRASPVLRFEAYLSMAYATSRINSLMELGDLPTTSTHTDTQRRAIGIICND